MIIGIVGTLASGKGTLVEYLKKKGFTHYSSSGTLRKILDEQKLPHTRENLALAAERLLDLYEGGVLELNLSSAKEAGVSDVVLEAIHRVSEADFIRSRGGKILGIDADLETRYRRGVARGEGAKDTVTFEEFKKDIEREEEGRGSVSSNIREVLKKADMVIQNNGTLEELYAQIDEALKKIV